MNTYNDTFVEQLVRRRRGGRETAVKVGILALALILVGLAYWYFTSIFPFFLALICILAFFAFQYTVKEFEYSFINGDVDVDKITGKRHRKNVLSISCREIKHMASCEKDPPSDNFDERLDYSENRRSHDRWYFTAEREDGKRLIVFLNPNDRLKDAFKLYLGQRMDYSAKLPEDNK